MRNPRSPKEIMDKFALTDDELKHSNEVAKYMYEHAEGNEDYKCEMYLLGLLHMFGKVTRHSNINKATSVFMERYDYNYIDELALVMDPNALTVSKELQLLNEAKMHVSSKGERVTIEEKLQEIKELCGGETTYYKKAEALARGIKKETVNLKAEYRSLCKQFMQYKDDYIARKMALDDDSAYTLQANYDFDIKGYPCRFTFFYDSNVDRLLSHLSILDSSMIYAPYIIDLDLPHLTQVHIEHNKPLIELLSKLDKSEVTIGEMLGFESDRYANTISVFVDFHDNLTGKALPYYTILHSTVMYKHNFLR